MVLLHVWSIIIVVEGIGLITEEVIYGILIFLFVCSDFTLINYPEYTGRGTSDK